MIRLVLLHGATFIAAAGGKTPLKQSIRCAAFKRWSNLTNRTWEQAALPSFIFAVRTTYYFFGCVVAPGVTPKASPCQNSTQPRSPGVHGFPWPLRWAHFFKFVFLMMLGCAVVFRSSRVIE
jgi:hypothetical protein